MILDKIENIETYQNLSPAIAEGLKILRDTDFSALEDGHYEVNDFLYYNVQAYCSKERNDTPESHRAYIDIQYIVSGKEKIGVGNISDMTETVEARPESDIWFHHGEVSVFTLHEKEFVILFPQDAHAPCIAVNMPENVRKVVVKVRI